MELLAAGSSTAAHNPAVVAFKLFRPVLGSQPGIPAKESVHLLAQKTWNSFSEQTSPDNIKQSLPQVGKLTGHGISL